MSSIMTGHSDDARERLVEEVFENILQKLKLHISFGKTCPKFFVIYAHDNDTRPEHQAHSSVVKQYISWFKLLGIDVDSDQSPHGLQPGRGSQIPGASNDILCNQLCLVPRDWDDRAVEFILVFGSKLLGSYVRDEQVFFLPQGEDLTQQLAKVYEKHDQILRDMNQTHPRGIPPNEREAIWDGMARNVSDVRDGIHRNMAGQFHHVLTELAMLRLRIKRERTPRVIPVLLDCDLNDSGLADICNEKLTMLWAQLGKRSKYELFLKLLLRFDGLDQHRTRIEAFESCLKKCLQISHRDNQSASQFREDCGHEILKTLDILIEITNHQAVGAGLHTVPTISDLRNVLEEYSRRHFSRMQRIVDGDDLPETLPDIGVFITRMGTKETQSATGSEQEFPETVAVRDLFQQREPSPGEILIPRRIIIRGLPGIGKTTLSKRIMYEYTCDLELRHKFDLVLRFPLKKFRQTNDLSTLLHAEYFNTNPDGHEFAKVLARQILRDSNGDHQDRETISPRILYILDGLDETRGWPAENYALLNKLLDQRDAIILSRFGEVHKKMVPVDLEMEASGLDQDGIMNYIGDEHIVSSQDAEDIRHFLISNTSAVDMARVPIHLDIICYSWKSLRQSRLHDLKETADMLPPTLTEIYQTAVHKLLWNDLSKATSPAPQPDSDEGIDPESRFEEGFDVLGKIAIKLVVEGRLDFTVRDIRSARIELRGERQAHHAFSEVTKLSVLRRSFDEVGGQPTYSFVHLTLQEFFAARHLAGPGDPSGRLREHLKKHKYNPNFDVVWRFVAGLLSEHDIDRFFDLISQDPRELIGKRHARLLMHSLAEGRTRMKKKNRENILTMLSDWVDMEPTSFQGALFSYLLEAPICWDVALPMEILEEKMLSPTYDIVNLLGGTPRIFSETLCRAIIHRGKDPKQVCNAIDALAKQPHLPASIINDLQKQLKDNENMPFASVVLLKHGKLSEFQVLEWARLSILRGGWGDLFYAPSRWSTLLPTSVLMQLADIAVHGSLPGREYARSELLNLPYLPREIRQSLEDAEEDLEHWKAKIRSIQDNPTILCAVLNDLQHEESSADILRCLMLLGCLETTSCIGSADLLNLQKVLEDFLASNTEKVVTWCEYLTNDHSLELDPLICRVLSRRLLCHSHAEVRQAVAKVLSWQRVNWVDAELASETFMRRMYLEEPLKLAALVGSGMSHFVDDPPSWLEAQLKMTRRPRVIVEVFELLRKQEFSMSDNWEGWHHIADVLADHDEPTTGLGMLLRSKPTLGPGMMSELIHRIVPHGRVADDKDILELSRALYGRHKAVACMLDRISESTPYLTTYSIMQLINEWTSSQRGQLSPEELDASHVEKLVELSRSFREAAQCLDNLEKLPVTAVKALLDWYKSDTKSTFMCLAIHLGEICPIAESFSAEDWTIFFQFGFLRQGPDKAGIAWLDGDTLYWYANESTTEPESLELREPRQFRERIRLAQGAAGYPNWAQVSPSPDDGLTLDGVQAAALRGAFGLGVLLGRIKTSTPRV